MSSTHSQPIIKFLSHSMIHSTIAIGFDFIFTTHNVSCLHSTSYLQITNLAVFLHVCTHNLSLSITLCRYYARLRGLNQIKVTQISGNQFHSKHKFALNERTDYDTQLSTELLLHFKASHESWILKKTLRKFQNSSLCDVFWSFILSEINFWNNRLKNLTWD